MKATTSTQFGQKFQQPTIEINKQDRNVQTKSTSKSHKYLVVSEVQDLLKWAYDQKTLNQIL